MSLLEYSEGVARWNPKTRHRHKCRFCKFLTTSFFCAVNHAKRHRTGLEPFHCQSNGVEKYFCRNCNYTTEVTTEFKHHISLFHGQTQSDVGSDKVSQSYLCEKCGFQTYSILSWLKHASNHHSKDLAALVERDKVVNPPQDKDETQWYACDRCEFKTQERRDLNAHALGHINKLCKCNQCGYETYEKMPLKHVVVTWYNCDKCVYKTREKLLLGQHIINSHLEEHEVHWYECDKCSFRCKHHLYLQLHYKTAHSYVPKRIGTFKCDGCPQVALTKSLLYHHVASTHLAGNDARWLKCGKCDFRAKHTAYLEMHDLEQHKLDHIMWYKCIQCDYKTDKASTLRQHELKHVVPWYKCEKCSSEKLPLQHTVVETHETQCDKSEVAPQKITT